MSVPIVTPINGTKLMDTLSRILPELLLLIKGFDLLLGTTGIKVAFILNEIASTLHSPEEECICYGINPRLNLKIKFSTLVGLNIMPLKYLYSKYPRATAAIKSNRGNAIKLTSRIMAKG
jgi:hypothetical protein